MPAELPARTREAEDAYLQLFLEVEDPEVIADAVSRAMDARRPQLAARLVGLLGDRVEVEAGSDLDRARKAASLLLMAEGPEDRSWSELEDAWGRARRRRMRRIRSRMRRALSGKAGGLNRLGKPRRRR